MVVLRPISTKSLSDESLSASALEFLAIISSATKALGNERAVKSIVGGAVNGGLIELSEISELAVIGDIHGDSKTLYRILDDLNFNKFLSDSKNKLIFLGDYIDRGSDSIGVLYCVLWLKTNYPDSVILLRGNHECPTIFPFASHDLPDKLVKRFHSEAEARKIYHQLLLLFDLLYLAVIVSNFAVIVHGGLPIDPDQNFRQRISQAVQNCGRDKWLEELLWSDPRQIDLPGSDWVTSRRGYGKHFGVRISQEWLRLSGTHAIIRGHEPCPGFRLDHSGRVLTLFSCTEAYPAFKAAYLIISSEAMKTVSSAQQLQGFVKLLDP